MNQRIKLDPLAYALLGAVIALQVYTAYFRTPDVGAIINASDEAYQAAVFSDDENKGVMHQVFRQNEINRDLLKAILHRCGR